MEFDKFSVVLLIRPDDAPQLDASTADALQDAHLAHLARLHAQGDLIAAGPVLGAPNRKLRGISIMAADPERSRALKADDPAVKAGLFRLEIYPWLVPAGVIKLSEAPLPRSIAEATGSAP